MSKAGRSTMKVSKSSWSCSPSSVVMRRPAGEIGLRPWRPSPSSTSTGTLPFCGLDDLHDTRQGPADLGRHILALGGGHQVGLVQDHEIGAEQLVLEHFLERIVVVERLVLGALAGKRLGIVGEAAGCDGGAIDHGDDAVDRHARGDLGPVEGLHQRLGQRQARCLDHDVLGRRSAGRADPSAPARSRRRRCSRCSRWPARRSHPQGSSRCRSSSGSRRRCRHRRTR